ncbi:MAG: dienelactone hydrolase family protein, partial [Methylocystis sp.]
MIEFEKISTPATGLEIQEARLPTRRGETPAYMAKPAGAQNCPIILIAQEIFGLNDHIRDIARRFAALGYLA